MHGFNRPLGPIGSNVVAPLQTSQLGNDGHRRTSVPRARRSIDFKGYFKVETFPHNSVIYRPGDTRDRVYLLKTGRVRLMRVGRNSQPLGRVHPPRRATSSASCSVPRARRRGAGGSRRRGRGVDHRGPDFRAQLEARPTLAADVIRAYAERVRGAAQARAGLTFKEVPARLADTLLTLAEAHGERCPHGGETDLRGITQQDLADLVGASRSFVSTLINEMKRDGMLGNVGRILCVRDQKALRKIASAEK